MLKIIHLDTGPDLRGGQQQLLMLARGLRERGHEQIIATLEGSALEARARQDGWRVFALPPHDLVHALGILQLRQIVGKEAFQILHAHDGKGQALSWFASAGTNARRVASRRVTFLPARTLDTRMKYGRTCDAVIAVSRYVRQLLVDSGVPESRVEVIPDGVEIPEALPNEAARIRMRAKWNCGVQEFIVGQMSAPTNEKGQNIARDALTLLKTSLPQARMMLAIAVSPGQVLLRDSPMQPSPPPSQAGVKYDSRPAGRFVVPENHLDFFAGLDLYIMPSLAEGLGSSALLAMAHGVPVVASRVGGLPEIVEDGVTGWLVPSGDPSALAAAIANAASNRPRLREMGAIARERARQYSSKLMVERTEKLYERLCH